MSDIIKLSSPATHEFWKIPVRYEDEQLLALDKPARLLASPDRNEPNRPSLMNLLHRDIERAAPWVRERQLTYLANAHRLDFETSGILLLAKNKPTLIRLADEFGVEQPTRIYVALVHGAPPKDVFEIIAGISQHPSRAGWMCLDGKHGKHAHTRFEVLERFSRYTLLRCQLLTARIHQVSVHLRARSLPVVGDAIYGGQPLLLSKLKPGYRFKADRDELPLLGRAAIHAEQLRLAHPTTEAALTITAPQPKDFEVALKFLRRYANAGQSPPRPEPAGAEITPTT